MGISQSLQIRIKKDQLPKTPDAMESKQNEEDKGTRVPHKTAYISASNHKLKDKRIHFLSKLHFLTRVDFYSVLLLPESLMSRLVHVQHLPGPGCFRSL